MQHGPADRANFDHLEILFERREDIGGADRLGRVGRDHVLDRRPRDLRLCRAGRQAAQAGRQLVEEAIDQPELGIAPLEAGRSDELMEVEHGIRPKRIPYGRVKRLQPLDMMHGLMREHRVNRARRQR